jgi:hypothetical protein
MSQDKVDLFNELSQLGSLADVSIALAKFAISMSKEGHFDREGARWVLRPENYVTLTPHYKRTDNLTVSLYGNHGEFLGFPELELKKGRGNSYSEFKLTRTDQLAAATFYIRRSKELRDQGRARFRKGQLLREHESN